MQIQLQPTESTPRSSARAPADAMLPTTGRRRLALQKRKIVRIWITAAALSYVGLTGLSYWLSPGGISLEILFLPVAAFAGWTMGPYRAAFVALGSTLLMFGVDARMGSSATNGWVLGCNGVLRFAGLAGAGWLAAWADRINRKLKRVTQEGAGPLQMEVEGHKETAARLREALELFNNATSNISEIFWVTDPSRGKVIYVSPGFEKIWGRPRWAFYQAPGVWLEAVHPQDRERVTQATTLQISGGYDEEYRVVLPDESVCWVHDRAFPLRNQKGEVYRIVGITEDITARKRAEQLVEAQRDVGMALSLTSDLKMGLQRLLVTASKLDGIDCGGVYLMDVESNAFKLEAHFGLTPDFVERVLRIEATSSEASTIKNPAVQYVVSGPEPAYGDGIWKGAGARALAVLPLKHSDRVIGALHLASRQHDNIPQQTLLVIESLATQAGGAINRLRAEESLHHSEARLRTTITSAPIAIFATDRTGAVTFQGGKELETIGLGPGAEGKPASAIYRDYPLMLENITRATGGDEFSSMVEFAGKVFECRFTPNTESQPTGYIAVALNVTERVRLEREILEVGDKEKARVGQDIHDGLCQQLVGAAFDANSLRQKLQGDDRFEAALAQRVFSHLDEAITESRRLAHGLYPVRLAREGLAPALEELANRTRERFGILCNCDIRSLSWPCDSTTATHLYRIAQEAVNNTLKHSGAKAITLALRETERAIELEIKDDGKGMNYPSRLASGMGLHIMDYRARSIGAILDIYGDAGTTVVCRLPKVASNS